MAKVKTVRYAGKADTYDLTVGGYHNFSICGGLIVHNCRYFCMSRHPESSIDSKLVFPKGTSEVDKERIRTNVQFEEVYKKMQGRKNSMFGW